MVLSISAISEPIGSIKSWIRPDATIPLPSGWLICDGSTVSDTSSPFNGIAIPDLRGRFPRGHATLTNANFGADAVYFTGGTIPAGGVDSVDLTHLHSLPDHNHPIPSEPDHDHGGTTGATTITAALGVGNGGKPEVNLDPHDHAIAVDGAHDHGGASTNTSLSTNNALASTENRPSYNELLLIIKVR